MISKTANWNEYRVCTALSNTTLQCALYSKWQLHIICLFTFHFGVVTTTHDHVYTSVAIPLITESIDRNMSPLTCQGSSLIQCFWLRPGRGRWEGSFSQVHSRALGCLELYRPSSLYFEWLHGWKDERPKIKEGKNWIMYKMHKRNFKHNLLSSACEKTQSQLLTPPLETTQLTVSSSGKKRKSRKWVPLKPR